MTSCSQVYVFLLVGLLSIVSAVNFNSDVNTELQNCDFWTSGTDQQEEGIWVWNTTATDAVSGSNSELLLNRISSRSANWQTGEPNNSNGQEHCLLMDWYARWTWNDASCNTERACYVCEIDMWSISKTSAQDTEDVSASRDHLSNLQ